MEQMLDEIAQNKSSLLDVLSKFYTSFSQTLSAAQKNLLSGQWQAHHKTGPGAENQASGSQPQNAATLTEEKCPACGSPMLLRTGKYGKFLSCSKYPQCKQTISLDRRGNRKLNQPTDIVCDKCGKPMVIRSGKRGQFLACTGFPKCRNTKNVVKTEPETKPDDGQVKDSN